MRAMSLVSIGIAWVASACVAADTDNPAGNTISAASDVLARGFHLHKSRSSNCLVARIGPGERPVQQTVCDRQFSDQDWTLLSVDESRVQIYNFDRQGCIVTRGRGVESVAVTTTCNSDFPDQVWNLLVDFSTGLLLFRNTNSDECLTARASSTAIQTTCGGASDQLWILD